MRFPIEIIAIFFLFFIWIAWMLWHKLSLKKLVRRYDEDENLSKKGHDKQEAETPDSKDKSGTGTGIKRASLNTPKSSRFKGRSSVQTKTISADRKNSKRSGNPLARRRKIK